MQGTKKRSHTRMFVLLGSVPGYGRLHGGGGKLSGTLHSTLEPLVMIKSVEFEVTALMGYLNV